MHWLFEAIVLVAVAASLGAAVSKLLQKWLSSSDKGAPDSLHDAQRAATDELAAQIVLELGEKLESLKQYDALVTRKAQLEADVARLASEQREAAAKHAQQRRDLDHEVGLLKRELEAESKTVKAQAALDADRRVLAAKEELLKKEAETFKEQIKFIEEYADKLMDLVPRLEARLKITQNE